MFPFSFASIPILDEEIHTDLKDSVKAMAEFTSASPISFFCSVTEAGNKKGRVLDL